jgi:L-serine deaminase
MGQRDGGACPASQVRPGIDAVWQAMDDCIERGLRMEGELARRAAGEAAGEGASTSN